MCGIRNHQVPSCGEPPFASVPLLEVVGLARATAAQAGEVGVAHHQPLPVRLEEEADLGNGRRVAEERGVLGDCIQVEALDRRERSPDLLEATAEVGPIEQVDERAFEPGVVAENGITGEAGGQKAGVHRGSPRVRGRGHHGVEPSAQLEQVARPNVVAKESVHGLRSARAVGPQMRRQLGQEADYLAMNPMGLVPTLIEDDFTLFESNVITRYLCEKHGHGSLCPADPRVRATADTWMHWQQTVCAPMMRPVFWGLARTPEAERDHDAINADIERGYTVWGVLDRHLADRPFVVGDTLTMGDIPIDPQVIAGSTWWRSARRCRTWRRGIGASPSTRHSART